MSLKKFFSKIGDFFEGMFNAAKRTWNKLDPALQASMVKGSAIIEYINRNLDKTPDFIIAIVLQKFPDFDKEKLRLALEAVNKSLKIADDIEDPDLETTIINLQKYLSGLKGAPWAVVSNMMANLIAIALAPRGTKVAAIVQLMEYVYQTFVKRKPGI